MKIVWGLLFAVVLGTASTGKACVDFSGEYIEPTTQRNVSLTVEQTGCQYIRFVEVVDEWVNDVSFSTDGLFRRYEPTPGNAYLGAAFHSESSFHTVATYDHPVTKSYRREMFLDSSNQLRIRHSRQVGATLQEWTVTLQRVK